MYFKSKEQCKNLQFLLTFQILTNIFFLVNNIVRVKATGNINKYSFNLLNFTV